MREMKKAVLGVFGGATGCWPELMGKAEAESL